MPKVAWSSLRLSKDIIFAKIKRSPFIFSQTQRYISPGFISFLYTSSTRTQRKKNPRLLSPISSSPGKSPVTVQPVVQHHPSRCFTCRKKVGLMGFRCRCGTTFCGSHRYPEQHGCTFDFKVMGKEAIAKANPLVKAEKLEKI